MRALDQIDKARMIFGCANVLGLQGPSLDETDDQRVGIRIVHARRNAGGVRRTARGSFRRANDIVRGDVAAHALDITLAAVFNEKVVVGQSAGERNGRYTPAPAGQSGGQGDRILSRHGRFPTAGGSKLAVERRRKNLSGGRAIELDRVAARGRINFGSGSDFLDPVARDRETRQRVRNAHVFA
jgi:hypothetical protein